MTPSRKPAVVRGSAAASLATFAALAGHVTGGGRTPGPLGIVVPWVLSLMICILLSGRRLSVLRLSASVAASQTLFHVLFVLGTIEPSGSTVGHVHGAPLTLPAGAGLSEAVVADASMWVGHAIAAIATVVVTHRGERILLSLRAIAFQVGQWVRRRFRASTTLPALLEVARVLGAMSYRPAAIDAAVLATLRGRAPPVIRAI